MAYQLATAKIWDGGTWIPAAGAGSPIEFATISATTGSPTTGSFTDANGIAWNYYKFTGSGTMTLDTDGYLDVIVVGGGGGGHRADSTRWSCAPGGGVRWGIHWFGAGSKTVTVGAGGAVASMGGNSRFDTLYAGGADQGRATTGTVTGKWYGPDYGGGGLVYDYQTTGGTSPGNGAGNNGAGVTLTYDGTAREFGRGGFTGVNPTLFGAGGDADSAGATAGKDGIVIVKVPA